MDKNEYFARVFQGQVSSLENSVNNAKNRIKDLETQLKEEKLNLEGDLDLLAYAKKELKKYPVKGILDDDSCEDDEDLW